ncbi:MAG: DEAD/DEAH box helicase [Candidatus Magasanikbacteria bacterium]|nr:DEAD/DEAH box helicase [Candidatus Magasanikbacteria bacterium]
MSAFVKKYLAEKVSLQKMAGSLNRLSSVLAKSTIDLNPYQIHAALYAFNSPLSRGAILADEVGLGKTIEAGIIISQLWAEGKRKVLIMAPASLRKQWQDELLSKFGIESEVWDGPSFNAKVNSGEKVPFTYDGVFIVSYHFVYSHLGLIEKQPWNVVVIDEAHRFRRVFKGRDASKMAYDIREIIKDKPKVLLTATPLQNSLEELYGIASFIDDKLLGSPYSFKTKFIQPIKDRSELAKLRLEELRALLRGEESDDPLSISGVITRTLRKQVLEYVQFTDRTSMTFDFTPTDEEVELYEKVSAYLQHPDVAAITATQRNLMVLVYRKLLASSSFAIADTLKKLSENLKNELKLRNKEATVEKLNPESMIDEGLLEEFEESELEGIEYNQKKEKQRVDDAFSDDDIKKEIAELEGYYSLATKIKENTKGKELINALLQLFKQAKEKKWPEKAVVFTESTRTQDYLSKLLKEAELSFTEFNGSNSSPEAREAFNRWKKEFPEAASVGSSSANTRQALIHDFRTNTQVLLTTEAGAEGLNLQFANIVINYDLPWNPQRVEQRIGRCHRYGQKHQVVVANFLNTKNYADKRVLELLNEKLNLFNGLFGSSDEILGALESGLDFEKKILEIYQNCRSPEEYDKAFAKLQESLKDVISKTTLQYRNLLLESADQAVAALFKKTEAETKKAVSEFDRDLLSLCKLVLGEKIKPTEDEAVFAIDGYKFPIAFRELRDDEEGKISRAHKDHPVISKIIEDNLKLQTKPIPSLVFELSKHESIISQLSDATGKEGFVFLWKLKIAGVETEEILVPLVFLEKTNSEFSVLDVAIANEFIDVGSVDSGKTLESSPIKKEFLFQTWEKWKKPVVERYQKRNERLFDREIERISRFYNDYSLRTQDRIKKYEDEKKEIERKKDNSSDFAEREKYRKRIQDIDIQLGRLNMQVYKERAEGEKKREKEQKALRDKLELKFYEEMIAMTHFIIQ